MVESGKDALLIETGNDLIVGDLLDTDVEMEEAVLIKVALELVNFNVEKGVVLASNMAASLCMFVLGERGCGGTTHFSHFVCVEEFGWRADLLCVVRLPHLPCASKCHIHN